jgi:exosome complex exonuclease RRP6
MRRLPNLYARPNSYFYRLLLTAPQGRDLKRSKPATDRLDWSLKRANILKPQNAFEKKTDNLESGPWKPLLTTKPHAQAPLDASLTTFTNEEGHTQYAPRISLLSGKTGHNADWVCRYKQPYEDEITNMQYPERVFESHEPIKYLPMEKTEAIWVDTYEGVLEMLDELKKSTEIAIDLEHHDYRSYPGLLSLMQISTREKDWIVDTLVPWRHKLEVLNEVFADPKIVKVRRFPQLCACGVLLTDSGASRCLYGHHLAATGPRLVCRGPIRYLLCL